MAILTANEAKQWLRLDGSDDDAVIEILVGAAEAYLKNATGLTFTGSDHLAKLFCLVLVTDWYENRDLIGERASDKIRFTVQSMLAQLQNILPAPPPAGEGAS